MSHDDWKSQHDQLKEDLKKDGVTFKADEVFYHLSYDAPFVMENRRNEIWVEVQKN